MKRFIFSILLCGLVFHSTSAQTLTYKHYSQFKGNVKAYLKANFEQRKSAYVGKTFAHLLKEMEIQPVGFEAVIRDSNEGTVSYIMLFLKRNNNKGINDEIKDYYIYLDWTKPIPNSVIVPLIRQFSPEKWVSQHYDFFKDMIIKNIVVYNNPI
jgi:hypothetical protein